MEVEETKILEKEIVEYIRKKRHGQNEKVGVMVAGLIDDTVAIGFSLCHYPYDQYDVIFSKEGFQKKVPGFGVYVAEERAMKWLNYWTKSINIIKPDNGFQYPSGSVLIPQSIEKDLKAFIGRAKRYYKEKKLAHWATTLIS